MSIRTGLTASLLSAAALVSTASLVAAEVRVTVYNNDLALVKETRRIEIPEGIGEFSFDGVPSRIDATSVRLDSGEGGDLSILEQNYRFDLVSRDKLLDRYLDQTIRIITKHDKMHEGVLKTAAGSIVLETDDGVVVVTSDEIADVTLPEIPEGLITRPTLVWTTENEGAVDREIEIAYLTGGIAWHAEYVAAVDANDERMLLGGWVSIENRSGGTYEDARLKVVAGDVHRATPAPVHLEDTVMMRAGRAPAFEERAFFEYHIYDLDRATTIADREVKQIRLFEDREVPLAKTYVVDSARGGTKVEVRLEFLNSEDNGLGIPLPGGKFRVYREDADGALEFAGEDLLDHTPRDEEVSVLLGNAFDLVAEREVMSSKRIADRITEQRIRVKLRNRKQEDAVRIIVREHPGGDWKVLESTIPGERKNARDLEFEVDVKAGEEAVLEYAVRSEY